MFCSYHVLRAVDVGDDLAHSSIRFGIGRYTTKEEIEYAADQIIDSVKRLREMSPFWRERDKADAGFNPTYA